MGSTTSSHNSITGSQKANYTVDNEDTSDNESLLLLMSREVDKTSAANRVKQNNISSQSSRFSVSNRDREEVIHNEPVLEKKDSFVKYCVSDNDVPIETMENSLCENADEEEEKDEDLSSESYPASSHYTENTDSVTGGFGLANRVSGSYHIRIFLSWI